MNYQLIRHRYHADIVELETGRTAARVYITERRPYPVCDHRGHLLFAALDPEEVLDEFERTPRTMSLLGNRCTPVKATQGLPNLSI